jgi:hypothetical protein
VEVAQRGARRTGEKWSSNEERIERERQVAKEKRARL